MKTTGSNRKMQASSAIALPTMSLSPFEQANTTPTNKQQHSFINSQIANGNETSKSGSKTNGQQPSQNDHAKITSLKKSEQPQQIMQSPQPDQGQQPSGTVGSKHNLKSSVSHNQLTYTLVSPSQAAAINTNKAFQPILSKKIDLTTSAPLQSHAKTTTNSSSQVRRSANSANFTQLAEKTKQRSGNKNVVIKEQPFNYEERQTGNQKSADHMILGKGHRLTSTFGTDNLKDISKSLVSQYDNALINHPIRSGLNDLQNMNLTIEDRDEVRMRPSDEVSMNNDQQLLLALGSFQHSRINSGFIVDGRKFDTTNNSYRVLVEESRSDTKGNEQEYQPVDEKFEVIREDGKDSFLSPRINDPRDNSDFKKFTGEDDFQSSFMESRWLQRTAAAAINGNVRDAYGTVDKRDQAVNDFKKLETSNFGSTQRRLVTLGQSEEDEDDGNIHSTRLDELQDTPQNIKERAKKSFFEEQLKPDMTIAGQNAFQSQLNDNNLAIAAFNDRQTPSVIQSSNFGGGGDKGEGQMGLYHSENQNQNFISQQNQAHILSFSEDNPMINQNVSEIGKQLPMSRETLSSQNCALNFQNSAGLKGKAEDSNAANTIIEIEKNYVIMQYETLLSQLSSEFQNVLTKAKDTDDHLAQQEILIQAQQKIISEREVSQFQQENLNQQLQMQVQELIQELEILSQENQRRQHAEGQSEASAVEMELLQQTIQNLQSKVRLHESSEICTKETVEQLHHRIRGQEARLRSKDEEIFGVQRMLAANERDIQNQREVENSLKLELQRSLTQRLAVEDSLQEQRQRSTGDQMLLRVRENEIETISREFKALKGSLESMQLSYAQAMRENDQLKITLNDHERSSINMKSLFQTREAQTGQLESDVQRLTTIIEKERQRSSRVEDDYRRKIEQLQNEMRDMQQRRDIEFATHHNNTKSYDNRGHFQRLNNNVTYQGSNNNSESRDPMINLGYEAAKGLSMAAPQHQEVAQISWLTTPNTKHHDQGHHQQSVVPQVQRPGREDISNNGLQTLGRRKTVNQNTASQLQDVLSWNKDQSQTVPLNSYKSLERHGNTGSVTYGKQDQTRSSNPSYTEREFSHHLSPKTNDNGFETLAAAGMKSKLVTSPFAVTQESQQKQLSHLQNTLSAMQVDKERVENEYRKLGTSKNKMQIQRKLEIEQEVEIINKNLHQIKQRLRELNAF